MTYSTYCGIQEILSEDRYLVIILYNKVMDDKKIKVRVRLIIIKNDKILLSFVNDENFHFFIGGKMEFGETLLQACLREVAEECDGAKFNFKKIRL